MVKTQLEQHRDAIAARLDKLFDLSIQALMQSMEAFKSLDQEFASSVKESTLVIEELSDSIEQNVFETIARRQPVARDLRALATYLQVAHHLYRVGRYAYKVAHIATLSKFSITAIRWPVCKKP